MLRAFLRSFRYMISPKTNSPNSETVKPRYFVVVDEPHITLKEAIERNRP